MMVALQMLRALGDHQRATQRRALALQTVQALAEQFGNLPWDQLTAQSAEEATVPAVAGVHLPGAKLAIEVQLEQEPLPAKRVTVALSWNGPGGQPSSPVRLTTWVYRPDSPPH
jgi:hypothetical protein